MAIHSWLRDKDRDFQRKVLTGLAIGLWVLSTTFTFDRIHDPRFDFQLTQNLPLHFCSLVTIMLMPAFILPEHNRWTRWYRAILFYPGLAAAFLAVAAPAVEYLDQPLFAMNTLFYFVHLGNVVLCALLASLGFYHPTIRDIFRSLIGFFVIAVAIFPLTLLIRAFIDGQANYFFEFDPAGSAIFDMLWAVIPIPLLYQVPLLVLIIPVLLLEYGIYRLAKKYHVGFHRRAGYLAR
jgi:hypothetical protein